MTCINNSNNFERAWSSAARWVFSQRPDRPHSIHYDGRRTSKHRSHKILFALVVSFTSLASQKGNSLPHTQWVIWFGHLSLTIASPLQLVKIEIHFSNRLVEEVITKKIICKTGLSYVKSPNEKCTSNCLSFAVSFKILISPWPGASIQRRLTFKQGLQVAPIAPNCIMTTPSSERGLSYDRAARLVETKYRGSPDRST